MQNLMIDHARKSDLAESVSIIEASGLLTTDLCLERTVLLVARRNDRIVGTVGLESLGAEHTLLRSLATDPANRREGIGAALCQRAIQEARRQGATGVYAMTETAEAFLLRRGFERLERGRAPAEVRAAPQFAGLCPASATLLRLEIGDRPSVFTRDVLALQPDAPGAKCIAVSLKSSTLSYFEVEPHAHFSRHAHEGEQITLVLEGELHFRFDDHTVSATALEAVSIPAGVHHEVWAGAEPVRAVDAWSPARPELGRHTLKSP